MVPDWGRCSGSGLYATITLADPPIAHTPVAVQKSVQSGTAAGVQEEMVEAGMKEKEGGGSRGKGDQKEETHFETAQTHGLHPCPSHSAGAFGPYRALYPRVKPQSRNKIPRDPWSELSS